MTQQPMRALITGASQGIGLAVARRLAVPGAQLALCASAPSTSLESAVTDVERQGASAVRLTGDLADSSVPAELVERATAGFGGLDAVVANAGIASASLLEEGDVADWDRVFAVNVRATWLLAIAARPWFPPSGGSIVAIGSISGVAPHPGMGAYSASKAASGMLVRQLAQEWGSDAIRVNAVVPGFVMTPRTEPVYENDDLREARTTMVPLGRIASAEDDIAGAVAFLLSGESGYCTGQQLVVDGGVADSIFTHDPGWRAYTHGTDSARHEESKTRR